MTILWLVLGVLIGALIVVLARRPGGIKLAWYDWVLLALALVLYVLAIANFSGSMEELEPNAAWFLLAAFGIPGLVLTAIVGVRMWRSYRQAAPGQQSS